MQAFAHLIRRSAAWGAALAVTLTCVVVAPTSAWACGGFFCFTQPIDQSAERILYIKKGNQITVHIQISYTGEDQKFSWILPLTAKPTLGIGSDSIFQVLEGATSPRFQLDMQNVDGCYANMMCPMAAAGGGREDGNSTKGGVTVLGQEKVGPYDTVTLSGNSGAELIKWLNDNGYQQPAESAPLIDTYAKTGYVFLALKLQKDKSNGDLAPIVVTLEEPNPCLPLRLTAIAATPEMPIVAWVLGDHRAIPKNFLHVEINEATIDWLDPNNNYKNVVSKAVDQAAGHAFTTELAKPTSKVPVAFVSNPEAWKNHKLGTITEPGKMLTAMNELGLPRTTQMQQVIRKFIPKPAEFKDVSDQEFYMGCLPCEGCNDGPCAAMKAAVAKQGFDAAKMVEEIETMVIKPLLAMQDSYNASAYVTRLFTLVSPAEMNKDPMFAFNKELPEVDNVHTAKASPICEAGKNQAHSIKITFQSGQEMTVKLPDNSDWKFCRGFGGFGGFGGAAQFGKGDGAVNTAGGQPAYRVTVLDESGGPLEIDPRDAELVDAELSKAENGKPSLSEAFKASLGKSTWDPARPVVEPTNTGGNKPQVTNADSGGGCTAGGGAIAGAGWLLLLALGLIWRRRVA